VDGIDAGDAFQHEHQVQRQEIRPLGILDRSQMTVMVKVDLSIEFDFEAEDPRHQNIAEQIVCVAISSDIPMRGFVDMDGGRKNGD
jgi:hypothetical protein